MFELSPLLSTITGEAQRLPGFCCAVRRSAGRAHTDRMRSALTHADNNALRVLLAALFVGAGALHVLRPLFFDAIVPPYVPMPPRTATLISGAAELAGGLGLLHPATRPAARWGLLALLVAVFPANLEMARHAEKFRQLPEWALWARLPLQPLLMYAVWKAGKR